ncbi:MAG: site-specific integrase [Thermoproteota archaeon]|nr:site-specific integrase [Thermoproteota archaeon]
MEATTKVWLLKKRVKKEGRYPVKIKVIYNRLICFYQTGVDLTEQEFNQYHSRKDLRKQFDDIIFYLNKADKIIKDLGHSFSWQEFDSLYFNRVNLKENTLPHSGSLDIIKQVQEYTQLLTNEGRISSAESYATTANHLKNFAGKKNQTLYFSSVTPEFLRSFEKFLFQSAKIKSYASIGVYMRNIRCIFNRGLSKKLISADAYPFGKNKYSPPATKKSKRALSIDDIGKIYNYQCKGINSITEWARDMWLFAYFSNGMNVKDIASLKYENIQKDKKSFKFIREKTKNSTKDNIQIIEVIITEEIQRICDKWGSKPIKPLNYIFDIFDPTKMSDKGKRDAVKNASKNIGKYMKKIAVELSLEATPTYIYARHSFSTILKRAGVPIEMISEQLGHTSIKTTETYLGSFESDQKREITKFLTSFKIKE